MRFFLLCLLALYARESQALELRTGDILLESLPCYVCSLIEIEEGAPYSHSTVVLVTPTGEIDALEAFGAVKRTPLKEVLKRRRRGTKTLVLRYAERDLGAESASVARLFDSEFAGRKFDSAFSWNDDALYCSEFVAKFLNRFLPRKILPKPMHFEKYREEWRKYFGDAPDGAPGLSPKDLISSPGFEIIGEI